MNLSKNEQVISKIIDLDWDSEILGIRCGYIDIRIDDKAPIDADIVTFAIKQSLDDATKNRFNFLSTKINAEHLEVVEFCCRCKARIVDTELTFHKYVTQERPSKSIVVPRNISIQKHRRYWNDSLFAIADTLTYSRFFRDTHIKKESADNLWKQSIFNSCNGRASYSIICFRDDASIGLMNIFENKGISDIFLIGLLPEYQNRGLGKAMIAFYEENIGPSVREQTVTTQAINYHAQSLYATAGYNPIQARHILHFWL